MGDAVDAARCCSTCRIVVPGGGREEDVVVVVVLVEASSVEKMLSDVESAFSESSEINSNRMCDGMRWSLSSGVESWR